MQNSERRVLSSNASRVSSERGVGRLEGVGVEDGVVSLEAAGVILIRFPGVDAPRPPSSLGACGGAALSRGVCVEGGVLLAGDSDDNDGVELV